MKREIDGHIYDTGRAEVIASHESGTTHIHRISTLYRSGDGRYFIVEEQEAHGIDGALLTPLSEAMAREWLENHGRVALAGSLFRSTGFLLRIEVDAELLCRIDCAAEAAGLAQQAWVLAAIHNTLAAAPGGGGSRQEPPAAHARVP
ncbi:MAG: hypothetical protein JNM48_07705 [Rhodospirillales bacterium]|nr:hypothetical protein [Rhodospirillales bacterium]